MTKNKKHEKKRSFAFRMLFYWTKFLGINTFTLSKNNELKRSYPSIFYACFLFTIYSYAVYRIVLQRMGMMLPGESPISVIVGFIHIVVGFFEVLLTLLYFVIRQNRVKSIVKSLGKIEKTLRNLKIAGDYEKIFVQLMIYLTIVNCFYVVWIILNDASVMAHSDNSTITWTCYFLLEIISLNTGVFFVSAVIVVREKFRRLNEKIKSSANNNYADELSNLEHEGSLEFIGNPSLWNSTLLSRQIDLISQLHRDLRDAIDRIMDFFSVLILLNITRQLSNITSTVHIIYYYLKGRETLTWQDLGYTGCNSLWIFFPVILLAIMSNACGSTSEEANKTGNIIHAMLSNREFFRDTREISIFNVFFLDLLQNQMTISLLGFIDVDYFSVYRTIATATTYITIMLQFYD